MNKPFISVIVPVYKAAHSLHRCIESILTQTFTDFELLLIDDGSPDESGRICDDYAHKDCRVRVFHQKNSGVSAARNRGISEAQGEWLTFVDADDYLCEHFFDIKSDSAADLLLQRKKTFGSAEVVEEYPRQIYQGADMRNFLGGNAQNELFRAPWGKFLRASVIQENNIRFDTRYCLGEDALFMLDFFACCNGIQSIGTSYYMYYLTGEFIGKYNMSVNECLRYVSDLMRSYHKARLQNKEYLKQVYTFNTGMVLSHHNYADTHKWFSAEESRCLFHAVKDVLRKKTIVKYKLEAIKAYWHCRFL